MKKAIDLHMMMSHSIDVINIDELFSLCEHQVNDYMNINLSESGEFVLSRKHTIPEDEAPCCQR